MPLTTNTSPYFDDFDENKQFYRILFRPGYPVQARELTQLQTALQKQIARFGNHVFAHGSRVIGGEFSYNKCNYIKVSDHPKQDTSLGEIDLTQIYNSSDLLGAKLMLDDAAVTANGPGDYTLGTDGTVMHPDGRQPIAQVILTAPRDGTDEPTILLNYSSGDEFQANDYIKAVGDSTTFPSVSSFHAVVNSIPSSTANVTGRASYAQVANGAYFIQVSSGGYFAYTPKQRIAIEKYTDEPTRKVGLKITESIVDETQDATLYDNAGGAYQNYAPGAHRIKVALDLAVDAEGDGVAINPESSQDFIELLRIKGGKKAYGSPTNQDPVYNILGDVMAQRTHDESGNYIVDDFDCVVEEESDPPTDRVKVILKPKEGKTSARAYIQGRKFELKQPLVKYINKARNTTNVVGQSTTTITGPSIIVRDLQASNTDGSSALEVGGLPFWDLHCVNSYSITTSSLEHYNATRVGTFRARSIANLGLQGNTHQIYLSDFKPSPALTGRFYQSPVAADIESNSSGAEVKNVYIRYANASASFPNAYVGSVIKITATDAHSQNSHLGQTRTVIASEVSGTNYQKLTLDVPISQPASNSGGTDAFPGKGESYSLSVGLQAAGTGNASIVDAGVVWTGTNATGMISTRAANAELLSGVTHVANVNPIMGGPDPALLYGIGSGPALVANTLAKPTTGTDIVYYAMFDGESTFATASHSTTFTAGKYRSATSADYASSVYFSSDNVGDYVLINESNGQVVPPLDFTMSVAANKETVAFVIAASSPFYPANGQKMRLVAPVRVTGTSAKQKTLRQGYNTYDAAGVVIANNRIAVSSELGRGYANGHIAIPNPNKTPGGRDNLGVVDIYKIRDIYDTGHPNLTANGKTLGVATCRVTNNYILDVGQRPHLYDYASIVLKEGARAPTGQLLVVYDWFETTETTSSFGFYSVDSYKGSGIGLGSIPSVTLDGGSKINLKDVLDFRPMRSMTNSAAANASYYTNVVSIGTHSESYSEAGQGIATPDPRGAAFYDMDAFASRVDKVVLSLERDGSSGANTGLIRIVSGTDDQVPPVPPRVSDLDLTLFTLRLPAYTFKASDVNVERHTHRRWTMKDISKINNRLERLEYYSSLNTLEQELNNLKIYDADGQFERFKNGFLVDTFKTGTAVADVGVPGAPNFDFQAAIGRGCLRPSVEQENIDLLYDPYNSSHVGESDGVLHLPYTINRLAAGGYGARSPGIRSGVDPQVFGGSVGDYGTVQNFAQLSATFDGAENINPFQVQNFVGSVILSPASDVWRSTVTTPRPKHIDNIGTLDAMRTMASTLNERMGGSITTWGEWEDNWYGIEDLTDSHITARDPNRAMEIAQAHTALHPDVVSAVAIGGQHGVRQSQNPSLMGLNYDNAETYGRKDWTYPLPTRSEYGAGIALPATHVGHWQTDYMSMVATRKSQKLHHQPNTWNPDGEEREGKQTIVTYPASTKVFDDEVTRRTYSGRQGRTSTRELWDVHTETVEIGEFTISSVAQQYMRPIDIAFSAEDIKPKTKYTPYFGEVDIRNYVERANELTVDGPLQNWRRLYRVLRRQGHNVERNPLAVHALTKELVYSSKFAGAGAGLTLGVHANTYYIGAANGSFAARTTAGALVDDEEYIHGSIVGSEGFNGLVRAINYKHYSGRVAAATTTTITLDESASKSHSWFKTEAGTGNQSTGAGRAFDRLEGSEDSDLFGKTIYVTEGRGYGQSRTISAYNNTNHQATVSTAWDVIPNANSRYSIGEIESNKYGSVQGIFHVPNSDYANRIMEGSREGTTTADGQVWDPNNTESADLTYDTTKFATGTQVFALRRSSDSDFATGSSAKAVFTSAGIIDTKQVTTQDIHSVVYTTEEVYEERDQTVTVDVPTGRQVEVGTICHFDPLAQSFLVDAQDHPEGVYVDSVDLWFKTKHDTAAGTDLPVRVQIRPTVGGVPDGGKVLGESIINAEDININTGDLENLPLPYNSDSYTTFQFPRPINLKPGKEYSVVILSNSLEYEVWTAVVGSRRVGTGGETGISEVIVDSQPHTGSLFKSQNGSTWTPEQNQDLMFRVNICQFDTSRTASLAWRTANAMSHYVPAHVRTDSGGLIRSLEGGNWPSGEHKPTSIYAGATGHKVWGKNFVYDRFRIDTTTTDFASAFYDFQYYSAAEGTTQAPGKTAADVQAVTSTGWKNVQLGVDTIPDDRLVILKDQLGSFLLKGTMFSNNPDVSPMINQERISLTMMRNLINDGGLYANTWPVNYVLLDDYAGGNTVGGGFVIDSPGQDYSSSDTIKVQAAGANTLGGSAKAKLLVNGTGSIVGVTLLNGDGVQSGNTYVVSPNITFTGSGSGGSISYHGEDKPTGPGNYLARYMTRAISLAEGFDSTNILVYLTAAQPIGTKVHVYAKVRSKEDPEPITKKSWQLLARGQAETTEVSRDESDFKEVSFTGALSGDEYPLAYTDGIPETDGGYRYTTFNEFAIKIVMQSNNPLRVPVVRDLRAIAVE